MAPRGAYNSYAVECEYEPQSIYLENGQETRICSELRKLGTKRILIISSEAVAAYKNVDDFIKKISSEGFRTFFYRRKLPYSSSSDINGAVSVYREFNCDTIVVFGGGADIFCAKMVSAMAVNNMKDPVEAEGYGKIRKDISVLCCIDMDNSTAVSSNISEFRDENTGRWVTVISNYLVPQIAVIETDIAMRTFTSESVNSALDSFIMAIECCMTPTADFFPTHKACAKNAISLVADNLVKMKDDPDDAFIRKKIAAAGLYSGVASRMCGLGYAHIIVHALKSKYGPECGRLYPRILSEIFKLTLDKFKDRIAGIYSGLLQDEVRVDLPDIPGNLPKYYSDEESALALIDLIDRFNAVVHKEDYNALHISEKEASALSDQIRTVASEFNLESLDQSIIVRVLTSL